MVVVVGRKAEVETVGRFLEGLRRGPGALLIEGEPGIGKSVLWQRAVEEATALGYRVLSCRGAAAETKLSYMALEDLLQPVLGEGMGMLPEPQRRGLEVALLKAEPTGSLLEARAVMLGALGVIRAATACGPVLIAVDDLQWVDGPSARALGFMARRLEDERIGILSTARPEPRAGVGRGSSGDRAVDVPWTARIWLGPLGEEAFTELVRDRVQSPLPRWVERRVSQMAGGNPLFGLEIARSLVREGLPRSPTESLPIPRSIQHAIRARLVGLSPGTRRVLLAVSALSRPTVAVVAGAAGPGVRVAEAVDEAVGSGVLIETESTLQLSHPLVGSVAYAQARPQERRELHRTLAEVLSDPEERARHLALAAEGPDPHVAEVLVEAARTATARGAPDAAALLLEEAIRLTPPDRGGGDLGTKHGSGMVLLSGRRAGPGQGATGAGDHGGSSWASAGGGPEAPRRPDLMPWQPSFVLLSALGSVRSAIQHDERLALPLELDRNLLVKGTLERRSGHKREARGSIGSVYRKLGIRSRTELAVGAKDYGLP